MEVVIIYQQDVTTITALFEIKNLGKNFTTYTISTLEITRGPPKWLMGFVCCYYSSGVLGRNLWTGESMKLPDLNANGFDQNGRMGFATDTKFYFGFEPVKGVYKLLKISLIGRFSRAATGNYLPYLDHLSVNVLC